MPSEPEAQGGFGCPICGINTPHQHSADEVQHWRDTEFWVEESWQKMLAILNAEKGSDHAQS